MKDSIVYRKIFRHPVALNQPKKSFPIAYMSLTANHSAVLLSVSCRSIVAPLSRRRLIMSKSPRKAAIIRGECCLDMRWLSTLAPCCKRSLAIGMLFINTAKPRGNALAQPSCDWPSPTEAPCSKSTSTTDACPCLTASKSGVSSSSSLFFLRSRLITSVQKIRTLQYISIKISSSVGLL